MHGHPAMARKEKVSAALQIFRDEGASALLAKLRYKADVWLKCFAARGVKSVTFDGCTFSLEMMPNSAMKISLLKKKYERFERHAVLSMSGRSTLWSSWAPASGWCLASRIAP